jgi:hypothetical protein
MEELGAFQFSFEDRSDLRRSSLLSDARCRSISEGPATRRVVGEHDCRAYLDYEPGNYCVAERDAIDLPLF